MEEFKEDTVKEDSFQESNKEEEGSLEELGDWVEEMEKARWKEDSPGEELVKEEVWPASWVNMFNAVTTNLPCMLGWPAKSTHPFDCVMCSV